MLFTDAPGAIETPFQVTRQQLQYTHGNWDVNPAGDGVS